MPKREGDGAFRVLVILGDGTTRETALNFERGGERSTSPCGSSAETRREINEHGPL
jgi:hypothetical protein